MTYGWAILVVLAAVGALAYFGVFDTDRLLPEQCTIETGMNCDNELVRTDGVQFRVTNGLSQAITNVNVTVQEIDGCTWDTNPTVIGNVANRDQFSVNIACNEGADTFAGRQEIDFTVNYQRSGEDVPRTKSGTVAGTAQ